MDSVAKQRVLLVDDEPQVLVALEDLLCDEFVVFKAESAKRALKLVECERDIAVVITDQRMPEMTGDELLAKLGNSSDALRILVTGFADLSSVIRAVNDGRIFAYVTKPWNTEDLRLKVHQAADHFRVLKELAYERQLLHDLMESIPDGIYFKDRDLRFVRMNRAFASSVDIDAPELLVGKRFDEIRAASASALTTELEENAILSEGREVRDVARQYTANGGARWFSETKAPIRSGQGDILGLVAISRDITERVRTAEALRESEERLRSQSLILESVLNSIGEGVIVTDRDGKSLVINPRAEKILGIDAPSVPLKEWGKAYGIYLADRQTPLPVDQNPLVRAMAGEDVAETEVFVKNPVVPGATVAVTATPLRNDKSELMGGVALIRDVTQQRKLEEQLRHAQKMDAIGQLAGGVAHDFNNLLVVIESYAELVFNDLSENDPKREDMREILAAARRASALTKQLLAVSRRQVVHIKPLALNGIVSDIEKMLRRTIGSNIVLSTVLAPGLWTMKSDAGHIELLILNLAINARDAMPNGGKLVIETNNVVLDAAYALTHAGVTPGEFVALTVSDTGVGMNTATQKRIFEPFFTTKEVGKGTGLGLSMVYGIVKQSGGHVAVHSEVSRGTSFKVFFPRYRGVSDAPFVARPQSLVPGGAETILLVEDDEAVRNLVVRVLRSSGYTVLDAHRAADARRACAERGTNIHLLLTDVATPEVTGPALASELANLQPAMRVLYMSGYSGNAQRNGGALPADVPYLEKPFTARSLVEKVRSVLDGAGEQDT